MTPLDWRLLEGSWDLVTAYARSLLYHPFCSWGKLHKSSQGIVTRAISPNISSC